MSNLCLTVASNLLSLTKHIVEGLLTRQKLTKIVSLRLPWLKYVVSKPGTFFHLTNSEKYNLYNTLPCEAKHMWMHIYIYTYIYIYSWKRSARHSSITLNTLFNLHSIAKLFVANTSMCGEVPPSQCCQTVCCQHLFVWGSSVVTVLPNCLLSTPLCVRIFRRHSVAKLFVANSSLCGDVPPSQCCQTACCQHPFVWEYSAVTVLPNCLLPTPLCVGMFHRRIASPAANHMTPSNEMTAAGASHDGQRVRVWCESINSWPWSCVLVPMRNSITELMHRIYFTA